MERKKNILVCPLDWGLGHATRMVTVIREIQKQGGNVIIAADNSPLAFLKQYFPELTFVKLEGFTPNYPAHGSMAWAMLRSFPAMVKSAKNARRKLKNILDEYNIDAIISDNRYELYCHKLPSVFVTHQLVIQTSGIQKIANPFIRLIINNYLKKYSEIWIPDDKVNSLSGDLAKSEEHNDISFFVGTLSRFNKSHTRVDQVDNDVLVMLSGPEPQRTILENGLLKQALETDFKTIILRGKPEDKEQEIIENVTIIPHASDDKIASLICSSNHVICRPGYSTLMDLSHLQKSAIFIPTPGQTEQEYLALRLMKEGVAFSQSQDSFNLLDAIARNNSYSGMKRYGDNIILRERITNLLNIC